MNNSNTTTALPAPLPDEVIFQVLTFLDVPNLVQKKQVSRTWQQYCTNAINAKRTPETAKVLQTNFELRFAVRQYCTIKENPKNAEVFACIYGYPIGKWDVSNITDFSYVFHVQFDFNEDINDWNVSNGTTMKGMFYGAEKFNKPLSSWDTSQVHDMERMFCEATAFNQDLSNFNTSQVTNMSRMFCEATSFNQNISNWDTTEVTETTDIFMNATAFHHQDYAPTFWDPI